MTNLKIGVVGYSRPQFDQEKATEMLKKGIAQFMEQFNAAKPNVEIVSGLTNVGIPKLAYEIAVAESLTTVGISAEEALKVSCGIFAVDKQIIEGKNFGDESQTFIDYIDCLIRVGGGEQSHEEVKMFQEKTQNKQQLLLEYELEFLG
ncbi:hypothetical protein [Candidatus Uabimicrobium amorphum]|uniref:Uncharacterized protein n=1 Tax=Uabimicrobium amorphum TaxID=2596890 RepID=A0A5S9IRZ4_UABAM|nr:hypothetical protein [Candidatus Uabimicrobium amorphum]BBM86516.1 hypothetical protein UABAM_04902 [Candidatus Uabimicrobium amorphum]